MPSNVRAVLYGRVSADRVHGRSVDSQLDAGHKWAERTGAQVVGVFRDDGISASRYAQGKTRPGWQDTVNLIEAREADVLWLWELSRATRDRMVYAALLAACQEAGVKIVLDERVYDPNDPHDAYQLDTSAATAVLESGLTSKRVQRAVGDRAAQGTPHGWVTYGYRPKYDPATGRLMGVDKETGKWMGRVPDEGTAPILQEIVERVLAGESVYGVAHDLNDRGIPAPKRGPWRGANIQRLICNPAYIGRRVWKGKDVGQAKWEPLITEDEHYQLLALYDDPARRKYRQDTRVKHLGTGIFRCGAEGCDGRMRVLSPKRRPAYYSCRVCHGISRLQEPVDAFVETLIWRRLSRPDALELLAEGSDSDIQEAAEEAARLKARLADVRRRVDAEELSLDDLTYFRARWEPKIREAEERARPKAAPAGLGEVMGEDAEQKWKALTIRDKRAYVASLVEVVILPVGRGKRGFDPEGLRITWRTG